MYVALLRSVNVAGRRLGMEDLRTVVTAAGFDGAATYVQSGNVVFAGRGTAKRAAREIEAHLVSHLGWSVPVLVRTRTELRAVLDAQPYPHDDLDPKTMHVTFLEGTPGRAEVEVLAAKGDRSGDDRAVLIGREVYLHCPGGYGRTKLNNGFLERVLAQTATTRNWRTVVALAGMVGLEP